MNRNFSTKRAFQRTLAISVASACLAMFSIAQAQSIDLGEASVLSQQGQRLKIAVPFGSEPGSHVPLLRFQVQSVEAAEGQKAPSARGFTISKPENRNIIFLQSNENITASNLKLVLAVAGSPDKSVAYDIAVPPASATTPALAAADTPKQKTLSKKFKKGASKYAARHGKAKRSIAKPASPNAVVASMGVR